MNKYTIYCTPEQTKKALELGAPILQWHGFKEDAFAHLPTGVIMDKGTIFFSPTAEQMINWLEEQGNIVEVDIETSQEDDKNNCLKFVWQYYIKDQYGDIINEEYLKYSSRKEATLAAIDAVLEYLGDKNLIK